MALINSKYFVYNGINSQNYNLMIAFFEDVDITTNGLHREVKKNEFNSVRYKTNTYGVIETDQIQFKFSIIKDPCSRTSEYFTQSESIAINEWLMSPTSPKLLSFIPENSYDEIGLSYYAICTSIEDEIVCGIAGKTITFETNSHYAFGNKIRNTYKIDGSLDIQMNNVSILENVHPILYISDVTSDSIVIENKTDNRVILYDFTQLDNKSLVIDNYRMTIKNDDKLIPVSKVGWTDDNIYWFRLKKGKNLISFTGNGTVVMEMESVRKAGCC